MQAEEKRPFTWRGWFAKKAKSLGISIVVAVVIAMGIRASVAEAFYSTNDAVAPEVPRHARVLVYKWADTFRPQDIIVYREAGRAMLGRVVSADAENVVVSRADRPNVTVPARDVVGRVVASTR